MIFNQLIMTIHAQVNRVNLKNPMSHYANSLLIIHRLEF